VVKAIVTTQTAQMSEKRVSAQVKLVIIEDMMQRLEGSIEVAGSPDVTFHQLRVQGARRLHRILTAAVADLEAQFDLRDRAAEGRPTIALDTDNSISREDAA
jgi:hypothetical protein